MGSKLAAVRLALILVSGLCAWACATAQTFPGRTIHIVASTPPGGTIDLVARLLAQHLPQARGQPVVVENKPGAAGNIAAEFVARSPADGYTLLVTASSHATSLNLYPKLSYHPVKDFAPISQLTSNDFVVVVPATSPANTLGEFLALAKSKKSDLSYGSSGSGQGNHLGMGLLKTMAGFDAVHVPYNGTGPVTLALLAGQIDVAIQSPPGVLPQSKGGRLKILATTGRNRSPLIPDVPTVAEAGVPGYELLGWIGLLAPAGTSREVVDVLQRESAKVLGRSDVTGQLRAVSSDVVASTPHQFDSFLDTEIARWARVIKQPGARVE